jgi:hypothetical protein
MTNTANGVGTFGPCFISASSSHVLAVRNKAIAGKVPPSDKKVLNRET